MEANADLDKEIAGGRRRCYLRLIMHQKNVGLISQRRKLIAEQTAKAQRDKPMTQAQQRQYMATYLKNQGGWKLSQIKKIIDEDLKVNWSIDGNMKGEVNERRGDLRLKKAVLEVILKKKLWEESVAGGNRYLQESGTEDDVEDYMEER
ncbi:hypothetical protein Tco_0281402 [Tanacetum coccineum]